jgi:hypothetical protein
MRAHIAIRKLINDSAIAAKTFLTLADENTPSPYITIELIDVDPQRSKSESGDLDVQEVLIQISSTDESESITIAEQIRALIDGRSFDVPYNSDTIHLQLVWMESQSNFIEAETNSKFYVYEQSYSVRERRTADYIRS